MAARALCIDFTATKNTVNDTAVQPWMDGTIVHGGRWRILVTSKSLTRGHVAYDTSGLFWKIAVRLDSPYLQQIASIRKMPTYAIACRTSIRRFKRANVQLIEQLNFVQNRIFEKKKSTRSRISVLKLYTHSVNLYTQVCKIVHTGVLVPNLGRTEI